MYSHTSTSQFALMFLSQQAPVPHHLLAPHFDFVFASEYHSENWFFRKLLAGLFTDTSIECNRSAVFTGNRQT